MSDYDLRMERINRMDAEDSMRELDRKYIKLRQAVRKYFRKEVTEEELKKMVGWPLGI